MLTLMPNQGKRRDGGHRLGSAERVKLSGLRHYARPDGIAREGNSACWAALPPRHADGRRVSGESGQF